MKQGNTKKRVVIVGAGIIGIALARELGDDFSVKVLEEKSAPAQVTSRLNSGVIHSGMHLPPHSLKARFAKEGSQRIQEYCRENNIPHRQCGMLVVASYTELLDVMAELRGFWRVYRRGKEQDVGMKFLLPWQIKALEPNVRAIGGLFAPGVTIVHQEKLIQSLVNDAKKKGVEFVYNTPVHQSVQKGGKYRLKAGAETLEADIVINAAGLYADKVSERLGGPTYPVYFYRGEYYQVQETSLVSRLVYPVYRLKSAGLGIHFTPTMDGRLLIGPNAKRVSGPEAYEEDKTPEHEFRSTVSRFCPSLKKATLSWAFSGIRPKLTNDGTEADFLIKVEQKDPTLINLIGIESPGFTASLALAAHVRGLVEKI